ncbi:hypothetical protein KKF63_06000, partial [bacterium]|nr:hypothetical protein [bacterium]
MNKISFIFLFFFILVFAVNCGGGSSGGDNNNDTGNSTISSLDDIPDVTSIVNGGGSSASLSALMKAVSGTPPKLADIDEDNADTYFWNGLIADINTNGATAEDAEAFWDGEGACRMAQEVGYSFQNISQNGTSLCYMKNAPQAASGTVVETGSEYLEGGDVSTMFNQGSETRIIKVEVTDMPKPEDMGEGMEDMNEEIFIQVYGTASTEGSAGYAVDLWFCHEEATPDSIEQIRVTEATNTITQTNINTGWGNYTSSFTGILTTDSEGSVSYDPNEEQSVVYTFEDPYWGSHKAKVTVDGSQMTTLGWNTYSSGGMSNEHKNYTVSSYTGS